jgi:hypothetical protein
VSGVEQAARQRNFLSTTHEKNDVINSTTAAAERRWSHLKSQSAALARFWRLRLHEPNAAAAAKEHTGHQHAEQQL